MANLQLKKTLLEIVDNQLRDNDPPAAKQAYQELQEAGYSKREAKEKIAAIVLTEIYDVLKNKEIYDEKRYASALREMVRQCRDFEDTHEIATEWDEWDDLAEKGYEAVDAGDEKLMVECWWKAWEVFQSIVAAYDEKLSVLALMEEEDYRYPVDEWLQNLEMELGNSGEHEKRMEFCRRVLEILDWSTEDDNNFRIAIGEELYATGRCEEGKAWFESQLKKEPHNANIWSSYSWCVQMKEGAEAAYRLIRKEVVGIPCTYQNELLFTRAKILAEHLQKEDDLKWITSQSEAFWDSLSEASTRNDLYDDFYMPVQKPVVKGKKIYPNDPCPCGSGKKYKKCCGRNK